MLSKMLGGNAGKVVDIAVALDTSAIPERTRMKEPGDLKALSEASLNSYSLTFCCLRFPARWRQCPVKLTKPLINCFAHAFPHQISVALFAPTCLRSLPEGGEVVVTEDMPPIRES